MTRPILLVVALATPLFLWRLDRPGFSDTEGMFAEPAREMVASGDWVTPTMNGQPFLVKPPLMYWLPATVFAVAGDTEYARIVPVLAALATVAVTGALGTMLVGASTGLAAAVVLATSIGFWLESRFLRADMVLMLTVTVALWCYVYLRRVGGGRAVATLFWAVIGLGLLDKGLLAPALPAAVIVLTEVWDGAAGAESLAARLSACLRMLHVPLGLAILAAIAVPWHLAAGARNPGFLWDYVVNQHVLFFFDEKLPRDSIPDSLGFFWTMFVVRGFPWSVLLPAALANALRRTGDPSARLPLAWIAVVLVLFSLAAGRLEHYSLPAMPAVALLVGSLVADCAAGRARVGRAWLAVPSVAVALGAVAFACMDAPTLLARLEPTLTGFAVDVLVRPALVALAIGLVGTTALVWWRGGRNVLAGGAMTAVVCMAFVQIAHERLEVLFSWRPFAQIIRQNATDGTPIFFRASDEYQLCGGLDYYTGRYVHLLAPPGWTPPTFLEGRTRELFTSAAALREGWEARSAVLVSDDVTDVDAEAALAPGAYVVIARAGERVLLAPPHARLAAGW